MTELKAIRPPAQNINDRRADTTTPLAGAEPETAPKVATIARKISIQTTIEHRGRSFTIQAEGMTLDQFCDLLDDRGYTPAQQTQEWQRLPDGTPICPKHHAPMRAREKQGDTWYSHNVGTKDAPVYCKGYHGKDSPGYEK
jgi:hypothetical protein